MSKISAMHYLFALIIPIISFFFQIYPRFFNRYFGVDVWSRMLETDYIRKNGHRVPKEKISGGFILEGFFNYPPVLPWMLSFLSKKTLFNIQGFIAPIFDILQNILVFFITWQITGQIEIAFLAQLIYATIPLTILENSYLTPRSLGYLNFTLAFYPLLLYSIQPNSLYLLISFIFLTLSFFTHKFAAQSLFFACLFFSIIENRTSPYLVIFFLSFFSAIILSRGYYLRILQGHIDNIRFWMRNYEYRFAHQVRGIIKQRGKTDFVGQVYYLLGTFTPLTLIGTNIWTIFPLIFFAASFLNWTFLPFDNPLIYKMSIWVVSFYILSILVLSIKYLIPIGEGQRYLEMALAPTAVISAIFFSSLLNTGHKDIGIIIFLSILFVNIALTIFVQRKGIIEDKNRSVTKDMKKIFSYINKLRFTPRILCIPHQITTLILYNTKAKVLVDIQAGTLQKIEDVFPTLRSSISEIAKKYSLNILVLKKDYASMKELKLSKKALLFETEDTQIFRI